MFLCLSSGSSPRYREDVLRAIAQPAGTDLQFRYRRRWLSTGMQDALKTIPTTRPTALIAYIDQRNNPAIPEIVPCRFAQLVDAQEHGSTVSLTLRLGGTAYARDLKDANGELRKMAPDLPVLNVEKGRLVGSWATALSGNPTSIRNESELESWELVVDQLLAHEDFASEEVFYFVHGIRNGSGHLAEKKDGRIVLDQPGDYALEVYHYYPKSELPRVSFFKVASSSPALRFWGGTVSAIDSPYDLKVFRFSADALLDSQRAVISLRKADSTAADSASGIDVPVTVKGQQFRFVGFGLLIGLSLASPQIVAALSNTT